MTNRNSSGEGSIRKRPDGRYELRVSVIGRDGAHKRISLYGATRKEVVAKRDALKTDLANGTFSEPSRVLVSEYLDRWVEHVERDLKPTTHESYKYLVETHIKPRIGKVRLSQLTPLHVEHMQSAMLKDNLSPRTVRYARAVLRRALKQAVRWNLAPRNVADNVDPPRQGRREMQAWTAAEARAFLAAAEGHELHALFHLALTTGMRRGELLGLRWGDIDWSARRLHVRQSLAIVDNKPLFIAPKTSNSVRTLHLPEETLAILRAHQNAQLARRAKAGERWRGLDLVFCARHGTPLGDSTLKRTWALLKAKAQVPDIRFHDMRHTYASVALAHGLMAKVVSERLGHASVAFTLQTYAHNYDDQRRAAAISAADLFGEEPPRGGEEPPNSEALERAE